MELSVPTSSRTWRLERPDRRGPLPTTIALALFLAGCTGAQHSSLSHQPSLRVADAALAAGAPDVALRVADLTLERNPRNPLALVAKGDAFYAMGQREEARAAYRQAVAIEPKLASAQLGLGRTLVQADPVAAETAFLAAISEQPDNSSALNDLGIARDLQGHHAEAQDAYRQALAITPGATDVKMNLGLSLALTGDKDAAVGVLREAAAVPAAVQNQRKELAAALALAGDEIDAQHMLSQDSAQSAANVTPAEMPLPVVTNSAALVAVKAKQDRSVGNQSVAAHTPAPPNPVVLSVPSSVLSAPVIAVARAKLRRPPDATPETLIGTTALPAAPFAAESTAAALLAEREPAKPTPETGAYVQLASLHSLEEARYEWRRLSKRLSELLDDHTPVIVKADARGRTYWLLRTFGFADLAGATAMCSEAQGASGLRCWARVAS